MTGGDLTRPLMRPSGARLSATQAGAPASGAVEAAVSRPIRSIHGKDFDRIMGALSTASPAISSSQSPAASVWSRLFAEPGCSFRS